MLGPASISALALALTSTVSATCHYGTSWFPREADVPVGTFGYTGDNGPLNWFGLNESANALCAKGRRQSPINIESNSSTWARHLKFSVDSYPQGAVFENLGTTLEVPANGSLCVGNKTYKLAQFHFHNPSEHRVDLEYFPMETHFVLEAEDASMAVVAFPIALGPADPLLASVFTYAAGVKTPGKATLTGPLDFHNLEHHFHSNKVYQYSGSLTTPPCSEGIEWYVSAAPLHIDQGTYDKVRDVIRFNSRVTQNGLGEMNLLQHAAMQLNS